MCFPEKGKKKRKKKKKKRSLFFAERVGVGDEVEGL